MKYIDAKYILYFLHVALAPSEVRLVSKRKLDTVSH